MRPIRLSIYEEPGGLRWSLAQYHDAAMAKVAGTILIWERRGSVQCSAPSDVTTALRVALVDVLDMLSEAEKP